MNIKLPMDGIELQTSGHVKQLLHQLFNYNYPLKTFCYN